MLRGLRGKRVTVMGLARSGVGAANLLAHLGASVTVTDIKGRDELTPFSGKLDPGVQCVLGSHPRELFENSSLVVISPGIPLNAGPLKWAAEKGIEIIGELELAYRALRLQDGRLTRMLAITGANGKSTTTTLLYEMLKKGGLPVMVGGNIGNALTEDICRLMQAGTPLPDTIVAEVSSFQLETVRDFRPAGAAILNVTPDHLDRYPSLNAYIDAKCRIFENQGAGDFLVLNADDPVTASMVDERAKSRRERPEVFSFSRVREVQGAYLRDGAIRFMLPSGRVPSLSADFTLATDTFAIKGVHNIENAMAAALMALLSGCPAGAVADTLSSFPGLEHRLEFVRELDGVRYINDSKGTNVGAVIKSLESFREPVVLIAGGRDKDSDFSPLRPVIRERVKALVLIGEAKDKLQKAVGDCPEIFMTDDFRAAVLKAKEMASPGEVVLLSPACASFDMFRDFEDRGRRFKEEVRAL